MKRLVMRRPRKELDPASIGIGWAYAIHIHKAMWPVLDIIARYRGQRLIWTQGDPPKYAFKEGDLIHARDGWHAVQVIKILGQDELEFILFRRIPRTRRSQNLRSSYKELEKRVCSQAEFVRYLRHGELREAGQVNVTFKKAPKKQRMAEQVEIF
jgi:hypothetical protein